VASGNEMRVTHIRNVSPMSTCENGALFSLKCGSEYGKGKICLYEREIIETGRHIIYLQFEFPCK